jgi:hypothetical protein
MTTSDSPPETSGRSLIRRDPNFARFWVAITISGASAYIWLLAMPLVAIASFDANAAQLGTLAAFQLAPVFVLTPIAGVLVDSLPARLVNSLCDVARGLLLLAIPLLSSLDALTIGWMYGLAGLVGSFKVVGDVAHHTMLPRVVDDADIVGGNAAISASWSVTDVAGPGLGGLAIQVLTAPFALIVNAVGFLASGALISSLHLSPQPETERANWLLMIKSGFTFLWRRPPLLMLGLSGGVANFFIQAYTTIFVLYAVDGLGLQPLGIGVLYAVGAVGGLVGAAVATWVASHLSRVGALFTGNVITGLGMIVVGLSALVTSPFQIAQAGVGVALYSGGLGIYNVHAISTRQQAAPLHMLGRVTASYRLLSHGSLPLGAVAGGFTADAIGLGWTCGLAGACLSVWMCLVLLTPFRGLNQLVEQRDSVTAA